MQFIFVLALSLGRSLKEIMNLPVAEFNAWRAYWNVSPFGDYRNDVQSGLICSTMANIHRASNTTPYSPGDFMPYTEKPSSSDEIIEKKITKFMKRYH